jgi:glutathione peroxidase
MNESMTIRQKVLRLIYPLTILRSKLRGSNNKILKNKNNVQPQVPVYGIQLELNNSNLQAMSSYKGKKILIVNTASDCGYTNQYEGLQKLYENNKKKLEIIGFPSNDFKEQEKGSDTEIAQFCKINFGVTFPLAKKSSVTKGPQQNKIFEWLSSKEKNGWLDHAPSWNFCKYLINEQGMLTHYFEAGIEPLNDIINTAINEATSS